jgi:uncharacterized protein YbjQ (UPF0145 family)
MIMTTTPSIEGRKIKRYCGIVAAEAILGANIFKDLFANITDIVGGRSGAYEKELRKARDMALQELGDAVVAAGGTAAIGVKLDYETMGGMLMVSATGTAVLLEGELH